MKKLVKKSIEVLYHFNCSKCEKWWTIGDAPKDRDEWFCPWCGFKNQYEKNSNRTS